MSSPFTHTTRALALDHGGPALVAWALGALGLVAWASWFLLGRVTVYEVTPQARLEVRQAAHALSAQAGGRVVGVRLALGQRVEAGEVLVELDAGADTLRHREEQARRDALAGQLAALDRELAAGGEAGAQELLAAQAAAQAAQGRMQEALAALADATAQARRLHEESAIGSVARVEALQAEAEARKAAASRDAQAAEQRRLQAVQAVEAAARRAGTAGLLRQRAALAGDLATAGAVLARLELDIDRHRVRAPVAGQVGELAPLRVGDVVAAGQKFATIVPAAGDFVVVADFDPAAAFGRVHAGQAARLRLAGFPWAQYGSLAATVSRVGSELRDGRLRVELTPQGALPPGLVLQHGLPGAVEVVVEQVAPAVLLLRASGQLLAGRVAGQVVP